MTTAGVVHAQRDAVPAIEWSDLVD